LGERGSGGRGSGGELSRLSFSRFSLLDFSLLDFSLSGFSLSGVSLSGVSLSGFAFRNPGVSGLKHGGHGSACVAGRQCLGQGQRVSANSREHLTPDYSLGPYRIGTLIWHISARRHRSAAVLPRKTRRVPKGPPGPEGDALPTRRTAHRTRCLRDAPPRDSLPAELST
jgi:hypothetical protein